LRCANWSGGGKVDESSHAGDLEWLETHACTGIGCKTTWLVEMSMRQVSDGDWLESLKLIWDGEDLVGIYIDISRVIGHEDLAVAIFA
jgi:hypothetical protein